MPTALKQVLVAALVLMPGGLRAEGFTFVFAGGASGDEKSATLEQLKERLKALDPKRAVVVFTGNYSTGELPEPGGAGRAEAERDLLAHVAATREFAGAGGKVYFLAGHRDFASGGTAAVRRLRQFLNDAFGADAEVMPLAGCGDPVVLDLTDELGLMLLNSQWWMQDWEADPQSNLGCEVKTRDSFRVQVRGAFNDFRTRRLVVASHHPLSSYGEVGAWMFAAESGFVPQYPPHPLVHAYVELLSEESERYGGFLFASGHDANLQYLTTGRQRQIVAGTSGAPAPAASARAGDFATPSAGWAELAIDASGEGKVTFFSSAAQVLFKTEIPAPAPFAAAPAWPPRPFPPNPVKATWSKSGGKQSSAAAKLVIGSFYGDAYTLELPYDTLNLQTEQGGLEPIKTGGGLQTNSLRLQDPQGGAWAMRATTKDASRFLGGQQAGGAADGTVSHGFTATHPEGALAVPVLASALGVLHAEPRLLYLPDQEGLGKYRGYIKDEVVMLERSPIELKHGTLPESMAGKPGPFGPTRFHTTAETIERMIDNPVKHRVDQEAWLRARLLDILIGDWDRHQNQWRFAAIPQADGAKSYQPIPRDRDQAFANYNGAVLSVARIVSPEARRLQPFNDDYGRLGWLIYGSRDLDPIFLNQLTHERWMQIAAEAKATLNDAVIERAFATWHPETWALDGERLAGHVKARRDQLLEVADGYFLLINENADVLGSARDDRFDLWFGDATVRITIRARGKEAPWFDRTFESGQTGELRLYALDGDDTLFVHGPAHSAVVVRFIGGEGHDVVAAAPGATGELLRAPAIRLYDSEGGAAIDRSIEVRDERSALASSNQYDRTENHEPNAGSFIPGLRVNPDEGALLGGAYTHVVHGYKKRPFAGMHELVGRFATATLGAAIEYRGLFPQSADLLDQQLEIRVQSPQWTRNFFGYTNRYVDGGEPLDFFRARQAAAEVRYGVRYSFGGERSRAGAHLVGQVIDTEATPGSFVSQSPASASALGTRGFAGARLFMETSTYDKPLLPTRGVGVRASITSRIDPSLSNPLSINYELRASAAIPFDRARRFVLLTRARVEGIVGEHQFYFAPTLGDTDLRAYHQHQLAGEFAFAHTTDLRIDVFRSGSAAPGTFGVNLSIDHGRVFGPSIAGDQYHLSVGGGLWWSLMGTTAISLSYYRGYDGGSRFALTLGPLFAAESP